MHLACIYLTAVGATLSAVFILAANSWMQNPVGYTINTTTGRAELDSIGAVFTNPVFIWALAHTILAAFVTASSVLLAIACWHLRRGREPEVFRRAAVLGLVVLFPATGLALMTGARLAVTMTELQPMKIAAMESLWNSEAPASFSIVQFGGMSEQDQTPAFDIEIPHLLSILATASWDGEVQGMNELQAQEQQQYGDGYYIPTIQFAYWSLRGMAYLGTLVLVISGTGLFLLWRKKLATARWFHRIATWAVVLPFVVNLCGWILAETGRQPWVVWGLQRTVDGVSPSVSAGQIAVTLGGFAVVYIVLAVIDGVLFVRFARKDLAPAAPEWTDDDPDDSEPTTIPALSY
jgi:cytochrome d ubiquinol oxidase subunit I